MTKELSRTIECDYPDFHFVANSDPITIPDGRGGFLTALTGARFRSADGYGQLVFFWHNKRFLGWNSKHEYKTMGVEAVGRGAFKVWYGGWTPETTDSRIVRWNGRKLVANRRPPGLHTVEPPDVKLVRAD